MALNPLDLLSALFAFRRQRAEVRGKVEQSRRGTDKAELAGALRTLGELERRTPLTRTRALEHYEEAVALLRELDDPLTLAHTIRHLGLVHQDAGRLAEAEKYYDEALAIYRKHESDDTLDYANAVRYPAAVKELLDKHDESATLWEEAYRRYDDVGIAAGVAEAAGRMTLFALAKGKADAARAWLEKAREAAEKADEPETHKFIDQVAAKFE